MRETEGERESEIAGLEREREREENMKANQKVNLKKHKVILINNASRDHSENNIEPFVIKVTSRFTEPHNR